MAVSAADIAPRAFQQPTHGQGEHQDVEEDLQVGGYPLCIFIQIAMQP